MTTGTNLQLQYDEATDSWSYENVNYEYPATGDTSWSGYTSPDPDFEFAPADPPPPTTDPCPPGYILDNTSQQCIPDPNYEPPQWSSQPQGGRDEPKPDPGNDPDNPLGIWIPPVQNEDGTWIEGHYKQMPKTMAQFDGQDLYDWGLSKGYIDGQGSIIGPMPTNALYGFGQVLNDRQFNNWLDFAKKEGAFIETAGKHGELSGFIKVPLTTQISNIPGVFPGSYMADVWSTYAMDSVKDDVETVETVETVEPYRGKSIVPAVTTGGGQQEFIDAAIKEEKLKQAKLDTERKERLVEREKAKDEGTGGSWGGDQEDRPVITPKKVPKTGQSYGPAGMGSSPPKPKPKQSYSPAGGPRPGDR